MKKEHYDRIANSVIFVVIGVVLTADRFPDYKPYLLGIATVAGAIAVWAYFKNRWASIEQVEDSTLEIAETAGKSEVVIQIADTFFGVASSEPVEQCFARYLGSDRISITIRRSAETELSEYLRNYVKNEFAAKSILTNSHLTIETKKNPKLKRNRKPELIVGDDYAFAA
jgi:hypothetical protein